jgi:hypothetical protein
MKSTMELCVHVCALGVPVPDEPDGFENPRHPSLLRLQKTVQSIPAETTPTRAPDGKWSKHIHPTVYWFAP